MKAAIAALSLALMGCSGVHDAHRSVFVVKTATSGGTAVVIRVEDRRIFLLTAKHVVATGGPYEVEGLGSAVLDSDHPDQDASILVVDEPEHVPPALPMRFSPLRFGEVLFSLGYSGLDGPWLDRGNYSGDDRATLSLWLRGSGGAVLDQDGNLVAMSVMLAVYPRPRWSPHPEGFNGHSYILPLSLLADWLR